MRNIATLVSWVFHPVWLGLLGTYLIFNQHAVLHSKLAQLNLNVIWLLVFLSTAVLPVVSGMLITGIKDVRSLADLSADQRRIFMVIAALYQLLLLYMFVRAGMSYFVMPFYVGSAISLVVCALMNLNWKMSLHALGWGGFLTMQVFLWSQSRSDFFFVVLCTVLIAGMVMSARLLLNAHSRSEIYAGFFTSGFIMTLTFLLYGYRI